MCGVLRRRSAVPRSGESRRRRAAQPSDESRDAAQCFPDSKRRRQRLQCSGARLTLAERLRNSMSDDADGGLSPTSPTRPSSSSRSPASTCCRTSASSTANATFAGMAGYTPRGDDRPPPVASSCSPTSSTTVLQQLPPAPAPATRRACASSPAALHKDGRTILIEIHGTRTIYRGRPRGGGRRHRIDRAPRATKRSCAARASNCSELTRLHHRKLEDQRLSFARDVHDELGGMLTALKMDVDARPAPRRERRAARDDARPAGADAEDDRGGQAHLRGRCGRARSTTSSCRVAIARDLEAVHAPLGHRRTRSRRRRATLRLPPKRADRDLPHLPRGTDQRRAACAGARRCAWRCRSNGDHFVLEPARRRLGFDLGAATATLARPAAHARARARDRRPAAHRIGARRRARGWC